MKPLKNILETARELGASDFVNYIVESGLDKELSREGAFTLFAPTNEAFQSIPFELRGRIDSYRGNIENPILRYHVSDRKIMSEHFHADMSVATLLDGNRIRINKYSTGVWIHWINLIIHYFWFELWNIFARGEPRTRADLVASSDTNQ